MDFEDICAWVEQTQPTQHDQHAQLAQHTQRPDGDALAEAAAHAARPVASAPSPVTAAALQYAAFGTGRFSAPSRSSSSSSAAALELPDQLDLAIPVRFTYPHVLERALPSDAQRLAESLSVVAAKEGVLPAPLRNHTDLAGSRVRPDMWAPADVGCTTLHEYQTARENHKRMRDITNDSVASLASSQSVAVWNHHVHSPFLKLALRHADGVGFEPVTEAHILPSSHPRFRLSRGDASAASTASGHNLADFALVLEPDQALQGLISEFLDGESYETASSNQTEYGPLRKHPAPVFIITKTSGNVESARAQLGLWIAAWHKRMHELIALGKTAERIITVPVILAIDGLWTLFFVVDGDTEIVSLARHFNRLC